MLYILAFLIIGIVLFFVPIFTIDKKKYQEKVEKKNKLFKIIDDNVIEKSKIFINNEVSKAIVIDDKNKKVHFFHYNNCYAYNYEDILKSEVIIDNNSILSSHRGKQVIGSVVGGIIAGVPGMIIGGLSNEQVLTEKIKSIELKLTVNDMNNSIYKINFISSSNNGLNKNLSEVKNALSEIEKWQGYFNIILKNQTRAI